VAPGASGAFGAAGSLERFEALLSPRGSELLARLDTDAVTPATALRAGLRVIDSGPWNQKQLPAKLRELDIGAVDIRRRGLAGDLDRLLRGLRLTGSRRATLVMTRAGNRPWGLICVNGE
jgi:hypothetical protein